ncbi:MAG: rod shape-determining protein MreC [Armatimonadetes bacterium]|nr:rod shape-determining protein MreC [Anaerolineae bacterium]
MINKRRWQGNRLLLLSLSLLLCAGLIAASATGLLTPVEGLLATPLNFISGLLNRVGLTVSTGVDDLQSLEDLRQRNSDLEDTLARIQVEVVALREIASDYNRLLALVNYASTLQDVEILAADVVSRDTTRSLRTVVINVGTRDGVRLNMVVVTENGLVGRITEITAGYARVMLVTSDDSAISARLQTSREEGSVIGRSETTMQLEMLPLNAVIAPGDLVLTSGLGGNLPPDLVIGQVESVQRFQSAAEQNAIIRSFVDFNRLEVVLVITSFVPVDFSVFDAAAADE